MSHIEKRSIIDESTERVFQYADAAQLDGSIRPGLIEVRDVHRLIDGVSYVNRVYTLTGAPLNSPNIQLQFDADQSALTTRLREFELVMTWDFQTDRLPRLTLDGDHTCWSQN
jgi:hypothetical protein